MESVKALNVLYTAQDYKLPKAIKIGIPVFLLISALIIMIFPGAEGNEMNAFLESASNSGFVRFFDQIDLSLPSLNVQKINISNSAVLYTLGGIGLVWMFFLSENFSRRRNTEN